jgi:hypothetical protein
MGGDCIAVSSSFVSLGRARIQTNETTHHCPVQALVCNSASGSARQHATAGTDTAQQSTAAGRRGRCRNSAALSQACTAPPTPQWGNTTLQNCTSAHLECPSSALCRQGRRRAASGSPQTPACRRRLRCGRGTDAPSGPPAGTEGEGGRVGPKRSGRTFETEDDEREDVQRWLQVQGLRALVG